MALTLADVETAISNIETGGQSVTVDGFTYNAGNLDVLIKLRDKLRAESGRSNGTRPLFRRFNFGGAAY